MDITGAVPVKINGKFSITITNFQRSNKRGTKVHRGAFGNFGTSQSPGSDITLTFKVSVPVDGFEFDWATEFGKKGASITLDLPNPLGFRGVKLSEDSLSIDEREGNTEQTISCTAEAEVPL